MTRIMFDVWMAKNWLHKLSMRRLFSRPNIDFMRIRYYWFTATIFLTVIGITVFIVRLSSDHSPLNIDFEGGTAYGGQLDPEQIKDLKGIGDLRALLGEESQKQRLQVAKVVEDPVPGKEGLIFDITYQNEEGTQTTRTILDTGARLRFPGPGEHAPETGVREERDERPAIRFDRRRQGRGRPIPENAVEAPGADAGRHSH
jgi:hypothetical protein